MNTYIYAKIGKGNSLVNQYLDGESEVNFPSIPIYFDCNFNNEVDFLRAKDTQGQGELFFKCGHDRDGKFIVVIHKGKIFILCPTGEVMFKKSSVQQDIDGYVKILPVEILKQIAISDAPMVLASIGANRYYSSGTFRQISNIGNIRAIQKVLDQTIEIPVNPGFTNAIECLSSVEFETLVAKILEESGAFVPSYRGGMMPGADLFAYNKSDRRISIGNLNIEAGARKSIQVKLKTGTPSSAPPQGIDFLVACDVHESRNTFGAQWLADALKQDSKTKGWLKSSLDWVPPTFIESTCGAL